MGEAAERWREAPAVEADVAPKSPWLLGPLWDSLLIGGASLALFAGAWLFVDSSSSTNQISWTAFYLAMAVNNPHFMASYMLLYWDKRHEMFKNPRFYWAGVIAPLLVMGYLAICISQKLTTALGYAVNAMYFLVGWHYIKQIYGTMIVTSARSGYFFSKAEAMALKINLFPVWFMSYFNGNESIRKLLHYGVSYNTLATPPWLTTVNNVGLVVSLLALGSLLFWKWVTEGKTPPTSALLSFAAIYVWYLPSGYHPHFWYMIPFFHSLQYLLFVLALKKNEYQAKAMETHGKDVMMARLTFARLFMGYLSIAVITAALTFQIIPNWLDRVVPYDETIFGPELFMFIFITFINIHHYFIDNVIWRRDNAALKKYLF